MKKILVFMCLAAITAMSGCGGGGTTPAVNTVSGVAAAGSAIVGQVYLKDSAATPTELNQAINVDGKYSFDVSKLTKPYILKAVGKVGTVDYTLYSFADDKGVANVNPMTHLVVAKAAAGIDPEAIYAEPTVDKMQSVSAKMTQALVDIQTSLKVLLQTYGSATVNPISDDYAVNHIGIDGMFDVVAIKVTPGPDGALNITNKSDSTIIVTCPVTGIMLGVITSANIPTAPSAKGFTVAMLSGKSLQESFTDGIIVYTLKADNTVTVTGSHAEIGSGTWAINAGGKLVLTFPSDSLTYTLLANNGTSLTISYHHGNATVEEASSDVITFVTPSLAPASSGNWNLKLTVMSSTCTKIIGGSQSVNMAVSTGVNSLTMTFAGGLNGFVTSTPLTGSLSSDGTFNATQNVPLSSTDGGYTAVFSGSMFAGGGYGTIVKTGTILPVGATVPLECSETDLFSATKL